MKSCDFVIVAMNVVIFSGRDIASRDFIHRDISDSSCRGIEVRDISDFSRRDAEVRDIFRS